MPLPVTARHYVSVARPLKENQSAPLPAPMGGVFPVWLSIGKTQICSVITAVNPSRPLTGRRNELPPIHY